jgi:hypothetical protein
MPSEQETNQAQNEQEETKYYWAREYRLLFPTINLEYNNLENKEGLAVEFDVSKDLTQETNKAKFTIRNLTEESRAKIEKQDLRVDFYAGYRDNDGPKRIFTGSIIRATTTDEGNHIKTVIEASDGQIAVRDAVFSLSYAPGTSGLIVVKAIAANMGLPLVLGDGVKFAAYTNGYSFVGHGGDALTEVCGGNGLDWSIQNGNIQIILNGGSLASRGLVFSPSSGLIGSPARIVKSSSFEDRDSPKKERRTKEKTQKPSKKAGWKIETLLAPTVSPGDAIKVESREIKGWFRVETLKHTGSSISGQFRTQMDIIEGLG